MGTESHYNIPCTKHIFHLLKAKFYNERELVPVGTVCGDLVLPKKDVVYGVVPLDYESRVEKITHEESVNIEQNTRKQAECVRWFNERKNRITASIFHKIVKRKMAITDKFVTSIKDPKQFHSKATSYGKTNEFKGRKEYVSTSGHHVHECGFVVNANFPYLGATPDGKVCDNGQTGILEIKCPFSQRDNSIDEAVQGADFCLEISLNGNKLKKTHDYYIQVQGQLLVTCAPFCDFVVYTKKSLHIERIYPDMNKMQDIFNKLSEFYFKYMLRPLQIDS